MEEQLCQALTGASQHLTKGATAGTGNMIIQGGSGSGKTVLATSMIKALQKETGKPNGKIGKIEASVLNQKDVAALLKKVAGGCLIIEKAGDLSRETALKLSLLLEQDTSGVLVIIEDTKHGIRRLYPEMMDLQRSFLRRSIFLFLPVMSWFRLQNLTQMNWDIPLMRWVCWRCITASVILSTLTGRQP